MDLNICDRKNPTWVDKVKKICFLLFTASWSLLWQLECNVIFHFCHLLFCKVQSWKGFWMARCEAAKMWARRLCKHAVTQCSNVLVRVGATASGACFVLFVCVCLSIRGRKHTIAAACLFSFAIFSFWSCQGPLKHPPTVGSSGLQCNGQLQTGIINLCHVFIHSTKHTCSPLMLPASPNVSKIHTTQWTRFGIWLYKLHVCYVGLPSGVSSLSMYQLLSPGSNPTKDLCNMSSPSPSPHVYCHFSLPSIKIKKQYPKKMHLSKCMSMVLWSQLSLWSRC